MKPFRAPKRVPPLFRCSPHSILSLLRRKTFKHGIIIIIMFVSAFREMGSEKLGEKFYFRSMLLIHHLNRSIYCFKMWEGEWKFRHKHGVYIFLHHWSYYAFSVRYIMPRLYIGKQYWKAYDNSIKRGKQKEGKRYKASDVENEDEKEEKNENNGVSHHFIYKIKVPFICHRYRYYSIFTGGYFQQHNIVSKIDKEKLHIFIGFSVWVTFADAAMTQMP